MTNQAVVTSKCYNIALYFISALYGLSEKGKQRIANNSWAVWLLRRRRGIFAQKIFACPPLAQGLTT